MSRMPWFPFWADDFMASPKVRRMDAEEIGIYLLLLIEQFQEGRVRGPIDELAILTRSTPQKVQKVLDLYFRFRSGRNPSWVSIEARAVRRRHTHRVRSQRLEKARQLGTHTKTEWLELVAEFDGLCVRCCQRPAWITKDHILPIYQGGSDAIENLQPLCHQCNSEKGPESIDWKSIRRAQRSP